MLGHHQHAGIYLAGRWWPAYSGISPTPHQIKKKSVKVGPSLTKFSGSPHALRLTVINLISTHWVHVLYRLFTMYGLNSFLASRSFYHLLINYANGLDPDQDRPNIGLYLKLNRLTLFLKELFEKIILKWLSGRVLDSRPSGWGFKPHDVTLLMSLSKNINPSLVLVQPRKTCPFITERLLMGCKESNKRNERKKLADDKSMKNYPACKRANYQSTQLCNFIISVWNPTCWWSWSACSTLF